MAASNGRLKALGEAVCPYCGVGCRLRVEGRGGRPERVRGVVDAPANRGGICAKGALVHEALAAPDRLTHPQVRCSRFADFRPTTWEAALAHLRECLHDILTTSGPDAVAFYGSGQLDTETAYLAGKLFKGHLGTN